MDGLAPDAVQIGMRVRARVQLTDGKGLVVFIGGDGMSHYPRPIPMTPQLKALRGATAITGVGLFGNGETPGYTEVELLARGRPARRGRRLV